MTDHHLFWLDEDRKWDLACDRLQWMIRRHSGTHKQTGKPKFEGRWYVGSKKRSLVEGFERFGIKLMAEARAMLEALPESYPLFRLHAYNRDGKFNGLAVAPRGPAQRDGAVPATQKCRIAKKRPRPNPRAPARQLEVR